MATVNFVCTSSAKLDEVPFKPAQIIFVQDERAIYLDGTTRTSYQQIIVLAKDSQRQALAIPLKGFYFVEDTKILWEYNGVDWIQVTPPPKQQIVFDSKENFPIPGDSTTLYMDGFKMYRYLNDDYHLVNNGSAEMEWKEI